MLHLVLRPGKYSVNVADWVTESSAAFTRFPAFSRVHGENPEHITNSPPRDLLPPPSSPPQVFDEDNNNGLFSQLLFPSRKHQQAPHASSFAEGNTSAGCGPLQGAPASYKHQQPRPYRRKCLESSRQLCRRVISASALAEAIRRHKYERRLPPSLSPRGHGGVMQEEEATGAQPGKSNAAFFLLQDIEFPYLSIAGILIFFHFY